MIDAATNAVTATITIPVTDGYPDAVAVDPAAGTVYVPDSSSNPGRVSVIDVATNAITATITVGFDPEGVAVDPAAGTVYVTNGDNGIVSVINVATNTVTGTISVGA